SDAALAGLPPINVPQVASRRPTGGADTRARTSGARPRRYPGRSLSLQHLLQAQPQRVQLDEAGGVLVVVIGDRALLEGHPVGRVQRLLAVAADHHGVALVELQA